MRVDMLKFGRFALDFRVYMKLFFEKQFIELGLDLDLMVQTILHMWYNASLFQLLR